MSRLCGTCIFRPHNVMDLQEGRVEGMVEQCLKKDTAIICHETMDDKQKHAVCRGFYSLHWQDVWPLRLARAFNKLEEVEPGK